MRARPCSRLAYAGWLAAAVLVLTSSACHSGNAPERDAKSDPPPRSERSAGSEPDPAQAARYAEWGCAICHGPDRRGTENAPALVDLSAHWDEDRLADYLLDPAKWRESDPRLRKAARTYPNLQMPPTRRPEAERKALAAWLLEDP